MPDPKLDAIVAAETDSWVIVDRHQDPDAYAQWLAFRAEHLGSRLEPQAFTVPSYTPPASPKGIAEYLAVVEHIRRAAGWRPPAGAAAKGKAPATKAVKATTTQAKV